MSDELDKREQVFWHIASKQADHVAELIHRAISFYLKGNLEQWYWTLTGLREIINFDLSEDEEKILDDNENEVKKYLGAYERYKKIINEGYKPPKKIVQGKALFLGKVRGYQRKIFKYLKQIGYFPDKEDHSRVGY